GYEHLLEIRKKNNTLQDALYHLVESTFELRKAFRPNVPVRNESPKIGRNDPCPCGSGKKYKQCCGKK
ncbi:MAG: SEC-C metal-binding domain-containing protein, partial [Sutterella sp.]